VSSANSLLAPRLALALGVVDTRAKADILVLKILDELTEDSV
jgi:hypothetical protein